MTDTIPEGALIDVRMTVRLPRAATREQIAEWLAVELASWPDELVAANPLRDEPVMTFTPDDVQWTDTGESGRIVEGGAPPGSLWPDAYIREPRR